MNVQETLKQIKILLGMEAKPIKMKRINLVDGTPVEIDDVEVGGKVMVVTDEETVVEAPAGSYELEDGAVLTVDESGTITEVIPVEETEETTEEMADPLKVDPTAPATPTTDEESPEATPKPDADPVTEERISTLEDEIANVETVVDEILEVLNVISVDMKAYRQKVEEIASQPSTTPVFHQKPEDTKLSTAEMRMAAIEKLRKK